MSENGSNYPVGYRRPPKSTQFKPGESGNSRGRPKGAKSSQTILKEELETKVRISENGKSRSRSKLQISFRQLVNKAAGGDLKAIAQLLAILREFDVAAESVSPLAPGVFDRPADQQTIASIVERIRLAILQSPAATSEGQASAANAENGGTAPARDDATDSSAPETGADIPNPKSKEDPSC